MIFAPSPELRSAVEEVASLSRDRSRFTELATETARRFGADAIPQLRTLYHGDPCPPPQYAEEFSGLGHWLSARQFAVFEIYFHLGQAALPELRSVAFGDYDWIQGNALEVLCRFAAAGTDRDAILQDIERESPNFRDEAMIYAVGPLIPYEDSMPGLREVLTFLREQAGFSWAYDTARRSYLERVHIAEKHATEEQKSKIEGNPTKSHERKKPWWKLW